WRCRMNACSSRSRSSSESASRLTKPACPSTARISSLSLRWIARASRFCVFWIRKTSRKVTTPVAVFTSKCQFSEKARKGPHTAQRRTSASALRNAHGEATASEARSAILRKVVLTVSHFLFSCCKYASASWRAVGLFLPAPLRARRLLQVRAALLDHHQQITLFFLR